MSVTDFNVSILGQKLEDFFETPETALAALETDLDWLGQDAIIVALESSFDKVHDDSNESDQGNEERAQSHRAKVIPN